MKQIGLPFWLAGGYGNPKQVQSALDAGAAGVAHRTTMAATSCRVMTAERVIMPVILLRRILRLIMVDNSRRFLSDLPLRNVVDKANWF